MPHTMTRKATSLAGHETPITLARAGRLRDVLEWVEEALHAPFLPRDFKQMRHERQFEADGIFGTAERPPHVAVLREVGALQVGQVAVGERLA